MHFRRGILGIEKLVQFLCKEWLQDIKKHQLSKILSGIGPTYAFVQLCKRFPSHICAFYCIVI